jgi:hypothetical protein
MRLDAPDPAAQNRQRARVLHTPSSKSQTRFEPFEKELEASLFVHDMF